MAQILFRANRAYPGIPDVTGDPESHSRALEAIKECIEIHERRTANHLDSFVRVRELVELGLIDLDGTVVTDDDADNDASNTHHHDSLYARLDAEGTSTFAIGGEDALQIEDPADLTGDETSLWLYDNDAGTLVQVVKGDDDSAGTGLAALAIPN